jgi:hypothetical protein
MVYVYFSMCGVEGSSLDAFNLIFHGYLQTFSLILLVVLIGNE